MSQKRKLHRIAKKQAGGVNDRHSTVAPTNPPSFTGSVPLLFAAAVLSGILNNATFGVINQ